MEFDEREVNPYSVPTRDGLKEKMEKMIGDVSDIFWISRSDATVVLVRHRWNSELVSLRLVEEKDKFLIESGLMKSDDDELDSELSGFSCGLCNKDCDEIDGNDELISTPICCHKFCTTCWRKYLNVCFAEKNNTMITCPHKACDAAVGPVTIEKFTLRDREMYERVVLQSFIEINMVKKINKCPSCNLMIEFANHKVEDAHNLDVVCLCGYTFCWKCKVETHRPVTCNNAADWLSRDLKNVNDSKTQSWMDANTKTCPSCLSPVLFDRYGLGFYSMVTCNCSFKFCWKCMKSDKDHRDETEKFVFCSASELEMEKDTDKMMSEEVGNICVDRWDAYQVTLDEAKKDLRDFDKYLATKPHKLTAQDIRISREALMLIIQCRQVLKWSCVYEFFHTEYENSKKEYLWFLQEHATSTLTSFLKTYLDETEAACKATTADQIFTFRQNINVATGNIGNYFYHFIKALDEGLGDVKVKSYNGVAGPYWYCDRCTFGNNWIHKHCHMCVDPAAAPCGEKPKCD